MHSVSDIEKAAGYQSYLPTQQNAAGSRIYAGFERNFKALSQGQLPTGGYAASAYDSVVLTAAALKATMAAPGSICARPCDAFASKDLAFLLLSHPVPTSRLDSQWTYLLRLNPPSKSSAADATTTVVSQINKENLYPKYAIGTPLPKAKSA